MNKKNCFSILLFMLFVSFANVKATTIITVSNITTSVTETGATVTWTSSAAGDSQIRYAEDLVSLPNQEWQIKPSYHAGNLNNSYTLTSLKPNTYYVFEVRSMNASVGESIPGSGHFTTQTNQIEKNIDIKIKNFKYYSTVNDQNVSSQVEFDLVNSKDNNAEFNLSVWNNTTNQPLKSGQYNLSPKQTAHIYLMDVNNIDYLALGTNNITIKIVSLNSQTVYSSSDFIVVRKQGDSITINTSPVSNYDQIPDINNSAKVLVDGKIAELLVEIKLLRDQLREQAAELKYLKTFAAEIKALNANMQSAIKAFIAYGVDDNTKKLGEGERAAVINSFKTAYDKLPETEAELADVIKIANGRWPSVTNDEAEKRVKEQFQKIYKRIADMNDSKDNAAITIMAYGLRQRAENRNLNSEKQGIQIFKDIYGHVPASTEDWNTMQAITYSGASRGVDTDGDLLVDSYEQELGTDPKNKDTDGDGYIDGVEVANGFDPLKK